MRRPCGAAASSRSDPAARRRFRSQADPSMTSARSFVASSLSRAKKKITASTTMTSTAVRTMAHTGGPPDSTRARKPMISTPRASHVRYRATHRPNEPGIPSALRRPSSRPLHRAAAEGAHDVRMDEQQQADDEQTPRGSAQRDRQRAPQRSGRIARDAGAGGGVHEHHPADRDEDDEDRHADHQADTDPDGRSLSPAPPPRRSRPAEALPG